MSNGLKLIIEDLENFHKINSSITSSLRSYPDLRAALEKLDQMVDLEEVKETIVLQLKFLISRLQDSKRNYKIFEDHMLHTVISGPPGVGKTELGKILAEIWTALGILEETSKRKAKLVNKNLVVVNEVIRVLTDLKDREVQKYGISSKDSRRYSFLISQLDFLKENLTAEEERISSQKSSLKFKVVSRADFVAEYVGQTAIKTKKLLEENLGGVLFIDEAYSLINRQDDPFGMEALTVLNQFMSEHSNEIIIIFAGYLDLLNETIFKKQPGLRRRCCWFFEIKNYSPESLSRIFQLQLNKYGYQVESSVNLVNFFKKNSSYFSNYGGDTAKFAFYCKLYHNNAEYELFKHRSLKRRPIEPNKNISEETIEIAFNKYKSNRAEKKEDLPPYGLYT